MEKPLIVPRIVWVGLGLMIMLIIVTSLAYWYETSNSSALDNNTPLFGLFSDAFKVGLGAFIGVMSQWASRVFGTEDDSPARTPPDQELSS
jgi:hypothetical protein